MALECCDHLERGLVIAAGFLDAVAVTAQRALQPRHQLAALAGLDRGAVEIERGRAYPMPDAGLAQQVPGKFLARILLARRRHIGMPKDALCADRPAAGDDRFAERDHRRDLPQREVAVAEFVSRIDDFDADRTRIDVGFPGPGRHAGMPGAQLLRHALHDTAALEHHVMRRHLAARRAQPLQRGLAGLHASIVQQDQVGRPALLALVMIGRGHHIGDDEGIRRKS